MAETGLQLFLNALTLLSGSLLFWRLKQEINRPKKLAEAINEDQYYSGEDNPILGFMGPKYKSKMRIAKCSGFVFIISLITNIALNSGRLFVHYS